MAGRGSRGVGGSSQASELPAALPAVGSIGVDTPVVNSKASLLPAAKLDELAILRARGVAPVLKSQVSLLPAARLGELAILSAVGSVTTVHGGVDAAVVTSRGVNTAGGEAGRGVNTTAVGSPGVDTTVVGSRGVDAAAVGCRGVNATRGEAGRGSGHSARFG